MDADGKSKVIAEISGNGTTRTVRREPAPGEVHLDITVDLGRIAERMREERDGQGADERPGGPNQNTRSPNGRAPG